MFFSGAATYMPTNGTPLPVAVDDRDFAWCPGREVNPACDSKVVIVNGKISYCCVHCWETVWAITRQEADDIPVHTHSTECGWRQERRKDAGVVEGTFETVTLSQPPTGRL
jgi:hypothetical protein